LTGAVCHGRWKSAKGLRRELAGIVSLLGSKIKMEKDCASRRIIERLCAEAEVVPCAPTGSALRYAEPEALSIPHPPRHIPHATQCPTQRQETYADRHGRQPRATEPASGWSLTVDWCWNSSSNSAFSQLHSDLTVGTMKPPQF
jgi:hypothetical protein